MSVHKGNYQRGDFIGGGAQSEMAAIDNVNFRGGYVLPVGFRL
ncbi:MAG TPA: hypothetical protein VMH20_12495 [Verrucomicrobiae bacterium]|nr:hypothetical protein [Verrucomicrobiae bacterium]